MVVGGLDIRRIFGGCDKVSYPKSMLFHPGNMWPGIVMKQSYDQAWTHAKKKKNKKK